MPTISEILAAKKAAAKQSAETEQASRKPTLAERAAAQAEEAEMRDVIDRIDPPGKRQAAASARAQVAKVTGIVLATELPASTPNGEPRGQATPIRGPEDMPPRSLGQSEGEAIDMTPTDATPTAQAWHAAVAALSTDLCIVRDWKDPERAWLAVRLPECPLHPILIKDLLLFDHPRAAKQPNEPF